MIMPRGLLTTTVGSFPKPPNLEKARNQRAQMAMIQKGFYGCVGVVVFIFLVLLFFF